LEPSHPETLLLQGLKALADETRLKILALLRQAPHTGEQLAALLDLRASTISHHLMRLRQAGLVRAEAESYYSVYRCEAGSLAAIAHQLTSVETLRRIADSLYEDAHARMQQERSRLRGRKPPTRRG
jgi:DNA-binding transcriptional ArsR family regulator